MHHFTKIILASTLLLNACTQKPDQNNTTETKVGNNVDAKGCNASTGEQWSVVHNSCIRIFEQGISLEPQDSTLDKSLATYIVFKTAEDDDTAEIFIPNKEGSILLIKEKGEGAGTWTGTDYKLNYWKGMYMLDNTAGKTLYMGTATKDNTSGGHNASATKTNELLQGKWNSNENNGSSFEIVKNKIIYYQDGKKVLESKFSFHADCKETVCSGLNSPIGCYSIQGQFDIQCFSITAISDKELKVVEAGTDGQVKAYTKSK